MKTDMNLLLVDQMNPFGNLANPQRNPAGTSEQSFPGDDVLITKSEIEPQLNSWKRSGNTTKMRKYPLCTQTEVFEK